MVRRHAIAVIQNLSGPGKGGVMVLYFSTGLKPEYRVCEKVTWFMEDVAPQFAGFGGL